MLENRSLESIFPHTMLAYLLYHLNLQSGHIYLKTVVQSSRLFNISCDKNRVCELRFQLTIHKKWVSIYFVYLFIFNDFCSILCGFWLSYGHLKLEMRFSSIYMVFFDLFYLLYFLMYFLLEKSLYELRIFYFGIFRYLYKKMTFCKTFFIVYF